ncbi:hypothetical protein E2C01_080303 [Portunus trituberculatus]|uniref:Uncharacterized protein n=1 Tax=Portunus trituberculatus TaxID=210409 RepID=A0A5B7IT31_PORTR|nr:hypothetical protein [Portunus trituberculatus]
MGQSMAAGLDVGCSSATTSLPVTTLTLRFPGSSLHTIMSSTRAELYAVLEEFHILAPLHKNVYFFNDSQAALYALQSTSPMDCDLVNN